MSWWTKTNAELTQALSGREDMLSEDELLQLGAFAGASASAVKRAFPDLIPGSLTDKPWEKGAEKSIGIGPNNTLWVIDPNSLRRGVWVLNASSEEAARNAQAVQAMTQWGYFLRTAETIPPIAELQAAGLTFAKGFTEAYYRFYPEQDPRPKNKPKSSAPTVRVTTYEVVGMLGGQPVPLTDVVRYVGGVDYELSEGASIAVTDSADDGFNLAGNPGKWGELYGGQSPAQFGLDRDKGVLFYNGKTGQGQALPAKVLSDWYGPGWRREIYGSR